MENVYPSGHELRYALNQTDYQTLRSRPRRGSSRKK